MSGTPEEFELVGGPQDGALVKRVGLLMPKEIFVGPVWQGDGYAAWGTERCEQLPARYLLMNAVAFRFRPNDDHLRVR